MEGSSLSTSNSPYNKLIYPNNIGRINTGNKQIAANSNENVFSQQYAEATRNADEFHTDNILNTIPHLNRNRESATTEENDTKDDVEVSVESDYSEYVPKYVTEFGLPHPDELIQSASLASVDLPPITYKLQIKDKKCVSSGSLSTAQLESIIYACQISEQRMKPDAQGLAKRKGFFLGDGAGVGKGRQLAGFVYENW